MATIGWVQFYTLVQIVGFRVSGVWGSSDTLHVAKKQNCQDRYAAAILGIKLGLPQGVYPFRSYGSMVATPHPTHSTLKPSTSHQTLNPTQSLNRNKH